MKIYVTSSNQYSFLLEPYSILFNRYWPGQSVEVLGFDESLVPPLPENFKFISLGNQNSGSWSDMLIPFFNSIDDKYFTLLLDDVVLMEYVDLEKIEFLENEFKSGQVQKAYLTCSQNGPGFKRNFDSFVYKDSVLDTNFLYPEEWPPNDPAGLKFEKKRTPRILEISQTADYRTTLHPAIWEKNYFLSFLKPGMSPWDFELANMPQSKKDGARIISIDQPNDLFESCNVFQSGGGKRFVIPYENNVLTYGARGPVRKKDVDFILSYVDKHWRD